jgi:uncharacterized membrane protein YdbT with pleckstrin-like domain
MSSDRRPALIGGESVVSTTRKHWAASIADSKWAILMIMAAFVLAWIQPDATGGLLGFLGRASELLRLGLFLGGVAWIIYNLVAWRSAQYWVTTLRTLGRDGLIRHRETDTLLSSITDVRTVSSFVGRALGYATLRITSASGQAGEDLFTTIRDAEEFKQHILEQKAAAAARPAAVSPVNASVPAVASSVLEYTEVIAQLAKLRDAGALTEAEFDGKKRELLARL